MSEPTQRDRFFSLALDMLCLASFEGYFIDLNPMWEPALGWTIEELKSKPTIDFVHPEDRASTLAETARLREGATTITFENRYQCKDGSYRWLKWSASPDIAEGCLYAVAHDITDEKQAAAALRKSEAQLQMIIDTSPNAVVTINGDGLITGWNARAEKLFGWKAKDVLGTPLVTTMIPPQHREAHRTGIEHFRRTGEGPLIGKVTEISAVDRAGREFPVELTISPASQIGDDTTVVAFIRDITERKTAEAFHTARLAVNRTLASVATWQEAAPLVLEAMCTALGCDLGESWTVDAEAGLLRRQYAWNASGADYDPFLSASVGRALAPGQSLAGGIWASGAAAAIENLSTAGFARSDAAGRVGLHGALGVPVFEVEGNVTGVVTFYSRDPGVASTEVLGLVSEMGIQIGIFLQRERSATAMEYQAMHDPLTGLPNRALFADRLDQLLLNADRGGQTATVLIIDLDGFKTVNDTLGHSYGDQLLVAIGQRLQNAMRSSDTIARLGGDEFGVLAAGAGDATSALFLADTLRALLAEPFVLGDQTIHSGGSIGVALYPEHGHHASLLLSHADAAMYAAKRQHAGYALYQPRPTASVRP